MSDRDNQTTTDDNRPIWRIFVKHAGETYEIEGYRPMRDGWNEAEADLIKMGWLDRKSA